jgi:hypothetical protein
MGHGAGFGLFERVICRSVATFITAYNGANEKSRLSQRQAIIDVMDPCGP